MRTVPYEISEYIREHFREGCLKQIESVKGSDGNIIFNVEIDENETIHRLQFDEKGRLLKHETEPMFEEDFYEGGFYGEERYD